MAKTEWGQGYSEVTPIKQLGFKLILGMLTKIAYYGQKKFGQIPNFIYVDCNSGCGFSRDDVSHIVQDGSPVIAWKILKESKIVDKYCFFCDQSLDALNSLKTIHQEYYSDIPSFFFHGNNDSIEFKHFVIKTVNKVNLKKIYGLIYSDPNGVKDYPIKNMKLFSNNNRLKSVDMLVNFNTVAQKRCRIVHDYALLTELLDAINKKKKFIRKPNGRWQFAHFLATNFEKAQDYKKIHLVNVLSEEGEERIKELTYTKSELAQLILDTEYQLNLFA